MCINPASAWDERRFRPNLLIATDNSLEGLVEAGQKLGIYASVIHPKRVTLDDVVELP